MTTGYLIQTIFELLFCALLLLVVKYEPVISEWEERTFYKILDKFKGGAKNVR